MKMKKLVLLAMMTAAIGSANLFGSFAAAEEESLQVGWVETANGWQYYDTTGKMVTSKWIAAEEGDGRGNAVWYYVDGSGKMVANTTMTIGGVSYTFAEDGSWIQPYVGATKGTVSGRTFTNTWSNMKLANMAGTVETYEGEDEFSGDDYASIGSPKLTHDLYLMTDDGDIEIYYADMSKKPNMGAPEFAAALAQTYKGKNGQVGAASTATVAGQQYTKISVTTKKFQRTFYCRKQDGYMVVIALSGSTGDMPKLEGVINGMTTAR